jgi:hypothetical protein
VSEPVDYEAVIADLDAKRAALDAAIAALRLAVSIGAQVTMGTAGAVPAKPIDPASIPDDAFFGLSIGEAAKKYLLMVKRKQSVREIADALERGGLPHTSSNFVNTVATMLNRTAKDQELVRVGRGEWGLAAWYGNRRPKQEPVKKTPKRAQSKAERSIKLRPTANKESSASSPGATVMEPSVRQLAERTLRAAGKPLHLTEILKRIEAETGRQVKRDTLAGLFSIAVRKNDMFTKTGPGTFGMIG